MSKRITLGLTGVAILALSPSSFAQSTLTAKASRFQPQPVTTLVESDRVKDGFVGPVRRVRTEVVKLAPTDGKVIEGKRALLEVVAYDIKGNKIENQYFPVAGATLTGKEVYKYDDKGNLSEMTLLNADGSLLSKETYKYEFDFAGNWNKMTTSVAVVEGGNFSFEPSEITYRSIMYYLDENMFKKAQPATQPAAAAPSMSNELVKVQPGSKVPDAAATVNKQPETSQPLPLSLPATTMAANKLSAMNVAETRDVPGTPKAGAQLVVLDSEPPPNPAPKPILKPVSGGVLNGTAISLPSPIYPEIARRMRTTGVVVVEVVVDENGKVISARAASGPPVLKDPAVQAALRARFSPTKLSGQPVKVFGAINYKFTLTP
jgi:periplasmic protein TonB